jgi:SAM-dependent methyltransferase
MPGRIHGDDRGAKAGVMYARLQQRLPKRLRRYIFHFEASIEDAVMAFSRSLPRESRVLDAGAGEGKYAGWFSRHRYVALDLGIGDTAWNYSSLDAIGDLQRLPFRDQSFDAVVNIVTLEHVREPALVLGELYRTLKQGGRILLVVPHEWEEHQQPHDYYRYTRFGAEYLLQKAGFREIVVQPVGGYFRLMSRRLLGGLQFSRWMLLLAPVALALPLLDSMDKQRNFTLGFICSARK